MKKAVAALGILTAFSAVSLFAADWSQWRGEHRDAHSADKGLAKTWPADGPKLAWKFDKAGIGSQRNDMTAAFINRRVECIDVRISKVQFVPAAQQTPQRFVASTTTACQQDTH